MNYLFCRLLSTQSKRRLFRKLVTWNHLGWTASINALGILPHENQMLTTEISSRGRYTLDENKSHLLNLGNRLNNFLCLFYCLDVFILAVLSVT